MIQVRNTADGMVHATRKTLEEAGDKATEEEKAAIEKAIADLEEALKGDDKADIEAKTNALTEASSTLAQKMYAEQAAQAEGAQGAPGGQQAGGSSKQDDNVVDAEFEEVKDNNK